MASAIQAIEWMIENAMAMPPGWAAPMLLRIHHIAPTDELAARIERKLFALSYKGGRPQLPSDLTSTSLLDPDRLTPILMELRTRKTYGQAYKEDVKALQALLDENPKAFWPQLLATQRVVSLYHFQELGLEAPVDFDDLYGEIFDGLKDRSIADVAKHNPTLYALTHLVILKTQYFRQYADPEPFEYMLPYFEAAIDRSIVEGMDDNAQDIGSEIILCLAFMRHPTDERIDRARKILVKMQNEDGSWGPDRAPDHVNIHGTLTGLLAVIDLPDTFRPDPVLRKYGETGD